MSEAKAVANGGDSDNKHTHMEKPKTDDADDLQRSPAVCEEDAEECEECEEEQRETDGTVESMDVE